MHFATSLNWRALAAAALAPPAGQPANRVGQRNLGAAGIALFGLGCAGFAIGAVPQAAAGPAPATGAIEASR